MNRTTASLAAIAAALLVPAAASASPILYAGSQQLGSVLARYSITTDGTLGDIDAFTHVTAYSVTLSDSISTLTYGRTQAAGGSGSLSGTFLASATGLTIPLFEGLNLYTNATSAQGSYVGQLNFGYDRTTTVIADLAHTSAAFVISTQNNRVTPFATAAAVPEASTWAAMIVGMGAIGVAMRRRRVRATVRFA